MYTLITFEKSNGSHLRPHETGLTMWTFLKLWSFVVEIDTYDRWAVIQLGKMTIFTVDLLQLSSYLLFS